MTGTEFSESTPPITDYHNFDLLITRSGDHYRAFVVDAPAGEASITFDRPFGRDQLPRMGGLAGVRRGPGVAPSGAADLAELGQRLFEAIFRDEVHTRLVTSLGNVTQEGAGLRLRLRFEEDAADLASLPWETLYDRDLDFVALGEQSPILRYLPLARSRSALLVEPPLRVLAVLSSPAGLRPLDLDREWQVIQEALAGLVADGKFELERLETPSRAALQERLLGEPVHILHFVGHGVFDPASQTGTLALVDADAQLHQVSGEELATILRNHPSLRLIYLNACEGALASEQSVFTGVAQALVRGGVPAAVAMQAEITDSGAIELAHTFYTALATGRPVDAALTQARVALSAAGSGEWAIPVLFSRSRDNRLFDIREVLPTPDCPFPGMAPFTEAQEACFFGRDREIEDAVARLRVFPFLAVVGASGSGKSSLIYAGVIPALRRSRHFGSGEWTIHTLRPSDHSTREGKAAPAQALAELLDGPADGLAAQTFAPKTLLFVDQFEEVFTQAETGEARAFLDALQSLVKRPNLYILLTVRADFLGDLMASSLWGSIRANRLELAPLGDDELWAAIVEPAARVGVTVDDALAVQLIADAAGERGVLPLVQETLVLLWDKVQRRQLGRDAYRQMAEGERSGLEVAIDRRASAVYKNLPDAAQPIARRIFLRLIQFGEGRADTRRQQMVGELGASGDDPALFDETLATLTDNRLLTASGEAPEGEGAGSLPATRRVDIAHEALIAGWPRLQTWLGQRRAAEQTRRRLEEKAREHLRLGKGGGLLDVYELQEAESWLHGEYAQDLGYSQSLLDLVEASREALAQAEADKEAQRRRELKQAEDLAKAERLRAEDADKATHELRRRLVLAVIIGLIAIAAAAAAVWFGVDASKQRDNTEIAMVTATVAQGQAEVEAQNAVEAGETAVAAGETAVAERVRADEQRDVAVSAVTAEATARLGADYARETAEAERHRAEEQSLIAQSRQVAAVARSELDRGNAERALLLAIGAYRTAATAEAENMLYQALAAWQGRVLMSGHKDRVSGAAISPDGQLAVTLSDDTVYLWELGGEHRVLTLSGHEGPLIGMGITKTGEYVVTLGRDQTARLWRVETGEEIWRVEFDGPMVSMVLSPDGKMLAFGGEDTRISVRDLATGGELGNLKHEGEGIPYGITFSPDSQALAAAYSDGLAQIWRGDREVVLEGHSGWVETIAYRPDGGTVATLDEGGTIRLWNSNTGEQLLATRDFEQPTGSLVFSPDGRFIAIPCANGSTYLWDLYEPDQRTAVFVGHTRPVASVAFSPDGYTFVTSSEDTTARLWDLGTRRTRTLFSGHEDMVWSASFSPDGESLITASNDGTARLWSVRQAPEVAMHRHDSIGKLLAFGPGTSILSVHEGTVYLWTPDGDEETALPIDVNGLQAAALSADGSSLATADEGGQVRVWNLAGGEIEVGPPVENGTAVRALAFHPEGRYLALGGRDGSVRVVDAETGAEQVALAGHQNDVTAAAFGPDGQVLATGSGDGTVRLWDWQEGEVRHVLEMGGAPVWAVAFSAGGEYLAAADEAGKIWVWDVTQDARLERSLPNDSRVRALAFSPAGDRLIAGAEDGTAYLWDWKARDVRELHGHWLWIESVAFDASGQYLATTGHDGTVRLWPASPEATISLACSRVSRDLGPEEWAQDVGEVAYPAICPGAAQPVWVEAERLPAPGEPIADRSAEEAPSPPTVFYFEAVPGTNARPGDAVVLRWNLIGATGAYLHSGEADAEGGGVAGDGKKTVTPEQTTVYRLRAINEAGETVKVLRIVVREGP